MIDYRFNGRLTYIPGGALSVNMSAWPAAGGSRIDAGRLLLRCATGDGRRGRDTHGG